MNRKSATALRILKWVWETGLIVVLPLVFWHGFAEQFTTPKVFLAEILIVAGLTIKSMEMLWQRSEHIPSRLTLPLLALCVAVLISTFNSPIPRFSLDESQLFLCGPACAWLFIAWNRGEADSRRVLSAIGIAGTAVGGVTLLQWRGLDPVLLGGYRVDWASMVPRMRFYSTFGNPNFVGGYLIATLFIAIGLAVSASSNRAKAVWWACSCIMMGAIAVTNSHGAWVGLAAGLIVAAALTVWGDQFRIHARGLHVATGQPVLLGSVLPLGAIAVPFLERIADQLRGRLYLNQFSWPMFWQHPWIGSGWGTYQLCFLELQGRFLAAHPGFTPYWTNNRILHNDPMQVLLEGGLLTFAASIWVLGAWAGQVTRIIRARPSSSATYLIAASAGGAVAILVDSIVNYQLAVPPTLVLLFILMAIPFILEGQEHPLPESISRGVQSLEEVSARRTAWKLGVSVTILCIAAGLARHQARLLESEWWYQEAIGLESNGNFQSAQNAFQQSVALNDLNGRAHFGLSRVLLGGGAGENALKEIRFAEKTYADSHQEVFRGRILMEMRKQNEALAAFRRAAWLDSTLDANAIRPNPSF